MGPAGWGCVTSGGAKFVASRRKLGRLKKQYSEQLTSGEGPGEREASTEVMQNPDRSKGKAMT
jgi:hypothetical protein